MKTVRVCKPGMPWLTINPSERQVDAVVQLYKNLGYEVEIVEVE